MKKTYAFLLSGTLLFSLGMYSCGSETTTGVETETTENEVDSRMNDEEGGNITEDSINPMDTTQNMESDTSTVDAEM